MKNYVKFIYFLTFITVIFSACKTEEETGTVVLRFKPVYNGNTTYMAKTENYLDQSAKTLSIDNLEFLVSNIWLEKKDGSKVTLSDVTYINMSSLGNQATAEEGVLLEKVIETGDYTKLHIGVGLTDDINSTEPGDYTTASPLGLTGNYWIGWSTYIYFKVDGSALDGSTRSNYVFHCGGNGMYQEANLVKSFTLTGGSTQELVIPVNTEKLFHTGYASRPVDLFNNTENLTHSAGLTGDAQYELAKEMTANLANALSIQ